MSKGIGSILLIVAAVAVNVIPGVGQAISGAIATTAFGAGIVSAAGAIALAGTIGSVITLASIAVGLSAAEKVLGLGPKAPTVSPTTLNRLNANLNPTAPRKMIAGRTAMATDIRYVEPSGTNQEYLDYIICVAAHRVFQIEEVWFEDKLAWTGSGGVPGEYAPYLTVTPVNEGSATNYITINGGTLWGANQRLTGCAYIHIRIKRTGATSKVTSPFASGLSSRMTIIGQGALLYDPRKDSTVAGGSGPQRATDQSTWTYDDGENIALQALWYLLGWRINGKLSVGRGIPPARLDLAGWITAANLCDEMVTTSTGSQPRYHGAGIIGEGDDPTQALATLATSCNGRFREELGRLTLAVMHNDLAIAAADPGLGDDEMIGEFTWNPDPSLEQCYNVVRGRYTDPSQASLFQLVDYPEVRIASLDGIDRILTLDLPWVQDAAMAQRLAKQTLERKQYQRQLSSVWNMAGWAYKVGDVVPITLSALGFNRRLFRVEQQIAGFDGTCPMILTEENAAIYAWDADDRAPVTPAAPITYDPLNNPILLAITDAGTTAEWPLVTDPANTKPADNATNSGDPNSAFGPNGTVNTFINRVVDVEDFLAPSGIVGQQYATLQEQIDATGGKDPRTDTLVTQATFLEASVRGAGNTSPNLLINPSFGDGLNNWTPSSAAAWATVAGFDIGPFAQSGTANAYLFQDVGVSAGGFYSLSASMDPDNAQGCYVKVDWLSSTGAYLSTAGVNVYSDGWVRGYSADNAIQAPGNAAKARIYCSMASGASGNGRFGQVQFQRGGIPTPFRDDSTANFNGSRITSEITLRNNLAGTYAIQLNSFASMFAGTQGSYLKSSIDSLSATVATNNTTISQRVDTLTSSISALSAPNLLANGGFTNGLSGWTQFGGANFSVITAYTPIFAQSSYNGGGLYTDVYDIQPSKNYCFGFEASDDSGDNGVYMAIQWWTTNFGMLIRQDTGAGTGHDGWGRREDTGPVAAPSNAAIARVVVYVYGNGGGNRRVGLVQFQQSDTPTGYSDASSLQGLQAQVTTQAGTLADISNIVNGTVVPRLSAYWQTSAAVGGAQAFIAAKADLGNGNIATSVAIGAQGFYVLNQVNGQWLKTFEVSGGNVMIYGNLAVAGSVSVGNLQYGAGGLYSIWYNENVATQSSTSQWLSFAQLELTPQDGQMIDGSIEFVLSSSGADTDALYRVRRDDGSIVKAPVSIRARAGGTAVSMGFVDSVNAGRDTTWFWECMKASDTVNVNMASCYGVVEEIGRGFVQHATITTAAGQGPGAGSAGGGSINGGTSQGGGAPAGGGGSGGGFGNSNNRLF